MTRPVYFRRFRKMNHRYWMAGLLTGMLLGFIPACRWTPPEGIANGPQSLTATNVLSEHHGGIERKSFKIPETLATRGEFKKLEWIFTRAEIFPQAGAQTGLVQLSSLTSEDLSRTQDPYYCAMRWDYGPRPEAGIKFFANRKLLIISPYQTIRAVVTRVVEWGPPVTSSGGIMLSQAVLSALGVSSGATVGIAFEADESAPTGPLVLGAQ